MKKAIGGLFLGAALFLSGCASTTPSPDEQLAARIKQEIAQTEGIGGARDLNVQAAKGVVILSGYMASEKQKEDAAQTALKVDGVQQVFNNIQVPGQASSGR